MLNPQQFRLLLAGPRVSRLHPFVVDRGYVCDAAADGETAIEYMRQSPRHVLLVEIELGDMLLADLLEVVRAENLAGAVILLDDPARSGLIVSTLTRGVDGYIATPPNEDFLFRMIERQLLAQWALAQAGQIQSDSQDKVRLEKAVQVERAKVTQLVKEIAGLREQLAQAEVRAESSPPPPKKAPPTSGGKPAPRGAMVDQTEPRPAYRSEEPIEDTRAKAPFEDSDDGAYQTEQRTSPHGYDRAEIEALLDDDTGNVATQASRGPASDEAAGFDENVATRAGEDLRQKPAKVPDLNEFGEASESDLFLDLDDEGGEDTDDGRAGNVIADPFDD